MCYLISLPQVILCAVMIRAYGLEFMVLWFYGFRVRVRVRAPLYVMILYVGFVEKPLKDVTRLDVTTNCREFEN